MANKTPITPEQRQAAQKKLMIIGIIVIAFLVGNFFYQLWRRHEAKPSTQHRCDLRQGSCRVVLPKDRAITFSIVPRTLPTNKPLTMTVTLENIKPEKVAVFLLALKTKQKNRQVIMKQKNNSTYEATATLAKTSNPQQTWMAMVVVKTKAETIGVPYKFQVDE